MPDRDAFFTKDTKIRLGPKLTGDALKTAASPCESNQRLLDDVANRKKAAAREAATEATPASKGDELQRPLRRIRSKTPSNPENPGPNPPSPALTSYTSTWEHASSDLLTRTPRLAEGRGESGESSPEAFRLASKCGDN